MYVLHVWYRKGGALLTQSEEPRTWDLRVLGSSLLLWQDTLSTLLNSWSRRCFAYVGLNSRAEYHAYIQNKMYEPERESEWVNRCFTLLSTVFQSYRDGVCLWQILRVLPHSAGSLEYRAANYPNTDTPPSHIILTPGKPVLVLSS